jgi:hypothetical protein
MSLPNCIVLATDLASRTDRAVSLTRAWRAKLTFVCAMDVAEVPSDELKEPAARDCSRSCWAALRWRYWVRCPPTS